jgi:hypothetical protein
VNPDLDLSGYGFVLGWYLNVMEQMLQNSTCFLSDSILEALKGV